MNLTDIPFDGLPLSKLFCDYHHNFENLKDFYQFNPGADREEGFSEFLKKRAAGFKDRDALVEELKRFNKPFNADQAAYDNIDRLKDPNAVTVVTGQQLNLFGGPLYIILKIATAINLSRRLESQHEVPAIPVFWLGDEDHDYDEIRHVYLPESDRVDHLSLSERDNPMPPVSQLEVGDDLQELISQVEEKLQDTDFKGDLVDLIKSCYSRGRTYRDAFGDLVSTLFSKHGLVLIGGHDQNFKNHAKPILLKSVREHRNIYDKLSDQTEAISKRYHQQVTLYRSNIFYLDDNSRRIKIHVDTEQGDEIWYTKEGQRWQKDELLDDIENHPERFSPNVFLRPMVQETLLPNVAYVGGPGEVAYYAQTMPLYDIMGITMPMVHPRITATILEHPIERVYNKLPFSIEEYAQRIEDLEQRFARQQEKEDIESIFSDWKEKVDQLVEEKADEIQEIDPTLKKSAAKATSGYFNELDKLKGKIHKSVKQQEKTQIDRIHRVKINLFPEGKPQERVFSMIYFLNKYGLDVWDILESHLQDSEFGKHQIIHV